MIKLLNCMVLATSVLILAGCEERYRYPCQNPENWENKYCQKPFCSANGTCPEDLKHYEKNKPGATPSSPQISNKGAGIC